MSETPLTNGTTTPRFRKLSAFPLTEYTATPTPPSERHEPLQDPDIPELFLQPNGYPDVKWSLQTISDNG
jgi:threonine dehydratase